MNMKERQVKTEVVMLLLAKEDMNGKSWKNEAHLMGWDGMGCNVREVIWDSKGTRRCHMIS